MSSTAHACLASVSHVMHDSLRCESITKQKHASFLCLPLFSITIPIKFLTVTIDARPEQGPTDAASVTRGIRRGRWPSGAGANGSGERHARRGSGGARARHRVWWSASVTSAQGQARRVVDQAQVRAMANRTWKQSSYKVRNVPLNVLSIVVVMYMDCANNQAMETSLWKKKPAHAYIWGTCRG
jgi:hypothetical protein